MHLDPSLLPGGQFSASAKVTYHRDDKQETVIIPVSGTIVDAKRRSLLFVAKPIGIGENIHQRFQLRGIKMERVTNLKETSDVGLKVDIIQEADAMDASLVVSGTPVWSGGKEVSVTFTDTSGPSKIVYDIYITVETKGK